MHDALVTLKNGKRVEGPIWTWRPSEGWFELAGEDGGPIRFDDVLSAEVEERTAPGIVENVDLLERARKDGWVPASES